MQTINAKLIHFKINNLMKNIHISSFVS